MHRLGDRFLDWINSEENETFHENTIWTLLFVVIVVFISIETIERCAAEERKRRDWLGSQTNRYDTSNDQYMKVGMKWSELHLEQKSDFLKIVEIYFNFLGFSIFSVICSRLLWCQNLCSQKTVLNFIIPARSKNYPNSYHFEVFFFGGKERK